MEYVGDVAWIVVYIIRCPTSAENLDEYYLARISECQLIDFYYSRSDRVELLSTIPINVRPTKRAPDVWDSAAPTASIFLASSFSCSQTLSTPAHTQVTRAVRQQKVKVMQSKLSVTDHVNNIAAFIARIAIPIWWFIWIVKSIQSGYLTGLVFFDPAKTRVPYPWFEVLQVCLLLAFESAILYMILRPDLQKWSFIRALTAFALFYGLVVVQSKESWDDLPGYAYMPGAFAISTVEILAIWLLVTIMHLMFTQLSLWRVHKNAA